jgi:hypothetical protein
MEKKNEITISKYLVIGLLCNQNKLRAIGK